jgi:hypothetical protein
MFLDCRRAAMYHRAPECWNVADRFSDFARSDKNFPAADCYRMRRAQNRRSQFPQRYCLIDTNLNNLSSKSRRRDRLIRSLLQSGHVITRKCLYSLIGRSKYPNSAYVVPSDETSIRACINPQILSLRRIAPGWGSAIIVRGCDSLVPVANVALFFNDLARSVKNFSRRCSHCWASRASLNHLCPSNELDNYGSTKHQRRSRLHLFVHLDQPLGAAGTPRRRSTTARGSSIPA